MEIIFVAGFILLVLFFVAQANPKKKVRTPKTTGIEHKKHEHLTTDNERKLFFALRKALSAKYLIHCQTSLIALVEPVEFRYKSKAWSKRVDFVITDTATKVIGVIELDDSTHKQKKRIERDKYVNNAFEDKHPLIRLPTKKFYEPKELAKTFEEKLGIENIFSKK